MNDRQIQNQFNITFRKAIDKPRICCVKDCNKNAINSHILQKNGILNGIEQQGHIRISLTDFLKDDLFYFKKEGINKAFTFKGFCAEHDKAIFAPIEDYENDYEDYKTQLLFAYRTVLNEKVKKEVLLDWHNFQRQDTLLKSMLNIKLLDESDKQEKLGISDLNYYIDKIEDDLNDNTERFIFKTRYTSSKGICLASHFTFESTRDRKDEIGKSGKDFDILTDIFVSFFPLDVENVFMMGYLKEFESRCGDFVQTFFEGKEEVFLKKLSNLLMCRCEMWACSENFYLEKIKPRENEINLIFQESAESIDEGRDIEFNIFQ